MKKGFTLVELLAVIAILAILVIIALPNVMGMFNTAKENSFKTEIKEIYKTAQQEWIMDNMSKANSEIYYIRIDGDYYALNGNDFVKDDSYKLDLSGRDDLDFGIYFNQAGQMEHFRATDGTYWYYSNSLDLKIEKITEVNKWADNKPMCYDYSNNSTSNPINSSYGDEYKVVKIIQQQLNLKECTDAEDFIKNGVGVGSSEEIKG